MLSIYPRNQSSCPAVAGAFFYVNLHLAQVSAHTGEEGIYSVFKVRFFRPFVSRQGSERYSPYHIGSMLYGLPLYLIGSLPIILIFTGKEKTSH